MAFYGSVQCADTDLVSVSCKLAHLSIDEVGECLGLQKSQVDDALKRVSVHHQDYNKAHLLLIKWQEVNGDAATQEALIQCMESLSNPHIINGIKGEPQKKAIYLMLEYVFDQLQYSKTDNFITTLGRHRRDGPQLMLLPLKLL